MFGLKKKGPSQPTGPFEHAFGCKVVVADPGFQPEWQDRERPLAADLPVLCRRPLRATRRHPSSARPVGSGHLPPPRRM